MVMVMVMVALGMRVMPRIAAAGGGQGKRCKQCEAQQTFHPIFLSNLDARPRRWLRPFGCGQPAIRMQAAARHG
ncbi:MAG: hypothetical protein NVS9B10_14550 [Nevskia sp.]